MKLIPLFVALIGALLFTSCATQSVYLQNISIDGGQVQPPLFLTDDNNIGDFRIAPRIQINDRTSLVGRGTGHSNVNARGVYQVDTLVENGVTRFVERSNVNTETFEGKNVLWEPTRFTASVDFDYVLAKSISLVGGINYTSAASQSYLGANLGVGFFFESKNIAARIDLGAHWSTLRYDVEYIVTTTPFSFGPSEKEIAFYRENGKDSHWNSYGAFTISTTSLSLPVQFFTQIAINRQTIVRLDRRARFSTDESTVLQSISFFLVTPGVSFDLSPKSRVLVGVQLRDETELLAAEPGVLLAPFVQFEFGL